MLLSLSYTVLQALSSLVLRAKPLAVTRVVSLLGVSFAHCSAWSSISYLYHTWWGIDASDSKDCAERYGYQVLSALWLCVFHFSR